MNIRKQVRLLVVDENEHYYDLIRESAEIWNEDYRIECEKVDSAEEAIQAICNWCPTIIMVDSHLDDMNCMDFLDRVSDGSAPLVVSSEHVCNQTRESVFAHGASDYISKTADPDEVDHLLGRIAMLSVQQEELN
jgi:CheY-like chemotaxis protein